MSHVLAESPSWQTLKVKTKTMTVTGVIMINNFNSLIVDPCVARKKYRLVARFGEDVALGTLH